MPAGKKEFNRENFTQHIVIDFEMNPVSRELASRGHYPHHMEIIEIGAVKVDSLFRAADEFSCTVREEFNNEVDIYVKRLTGIDTRETEGAVVLKDALSKLEAWIGYGEKTRIYSWSDSDLRQLRNECSAKGITFPKNMVSWMDFQAEYPKIMEITDLHKKQLSLHEAVERNGLEFDTSKAHRALYDARKTAELLIMVLDGSYKKQIELMRKAASDSGSSMGTLGELFGNVLAKAGTGGGTAVRSGNGRLRKS